MDIVILNDTLPQEHHGCRATSLALRALLLERFPGAMITGNHQRASRIIECLPVRMGERIMAGLLRKQDIGTPDLVVVNGEGTLHAHGYPLRRRNGAYIYRLMQAQHAMERGIATWIVNHSLFTDRADYLRLVAQVYPALQHTAVREPLSLQLLQQTVGGTIRQAADCAFLTPVPAPAVASPLANTIVISNSSRRWRQEDYHRLRRVITMVQRNTGCQVVYLSLYFNREDYRKAANLQIPFYEYRQTEEFLAHLQRAAFVISGRYHLAVFSALCGIPFATLRANTDKNRGLHALLNYEAPCYNPADMDPDAVAEDISTLFARRDTLATHLLGQRTRCQTLARNNVCGLR